MIFFLLYNFVVAAAKVRVWMQVKACFQMSEWLNVDQKNLNDAEKKNWVKAKKKEKKGYIQRPRNLQVFRKLKCANWYRLSSVPKHSF